MKLNGFRPEQTLVDTTSNIFYKCTATFPTPCIIIIKSVEKYLSKRGSTNWCSVDSEKALDSLHRKALWFKITDIGISQNKVSCTKTMCQNKTLCKIWRIRSVQLCSAYKRDRTWLRFEFLHI